MNKNDQARNMLFDKHQILHTIDDRWIFPISANQIKEFREPRLMTKFDHKSSLPEIFYHNSLSILPITRWTYVIGRFDTFKELEIDASAETVNFTIPTYIESIDFSNIYSESAALNCAYISGIISDFVGEETLPTISGRMSTNSFDFSINGDNKSYQIEVRNSQCEIDGWFEGMEKLLLVEAKNHLPNDFLVRQVYYPFRLWRDRVSKKVVNVFMTYSNDVFSFFEYAFVHPTEYNSIQLVRQKRYKIAPEEITMKDLQEILKSIKIREEPKVPFPQADKFNRVVDLLGLLMENDELEKNEITSNYGFDHRQTDYYANAWIYLGLIERKWQGVFQLTDEGKRILQLSHKDKYLWLIRAILSHKVFFQSMNLYLKMLKQIQVKQVVEIMDECGIRNVKSWNTVRRRAQSVIKRIDWILNQVE